tara:strand:+ start:1576 stop:2136 length:561 start_codon:yes stop_codon:yes gene_type:complete
MKIKETKKTLNDIINDVALIQKQLIVECSKCDGTGKPRTKLGKPPENGGGNARCGACYGEGTVGNRMDLIEKNITSIKKELKRIGDNLNNYVNRQFTEIRVLPKGHNPKLHGGNSPNKDENGWEDYSGDFYITDEEQKEMVIEKAKAHFEEYFENGVYHRNKRLGLFLSGGGQSGKKLIKETTTSN